MTKTIDRSDMRIQFDFNFASAQYTIAARQQARSKLRQVVRKSGEKEQAGLQEAIHRLSDPPGRLLKESFFTPGDLEALLPRLDAARAAVKAMRGDASKMMMWTELPYNQKAEVEAVKALAEEIRENADNFVVLGIGGSALGPMAMQQALNDLRYNELPMYKRGGPKLYVEDNIDPERMASLLNVLDLETTVFNVISKSGNTSETMSQFMIITDRLKQAFGDNYAEHVVVTTDASKGNLRKIADADGLRALVVPDGVGGRFSELCPVGLLAAAVCGIDIDLLLEGAADMDKRISEAKDTLSDPALFAAAIMYIASEEKGQNISVMMPYADSLRYIADWYAQLWAESLGKNVTRKGETAYVGQTPVKALGVTDQHSQVQLYTEGPTDKIITFLNVGKFRTDVTIPKTLTEFPDVSFLCGVTMGELLVVEQKATEYALLKAAKPSWSINLPEVNEYTIGQLLYFFEMMTAYAGELLDIDAFNQPGVEEGKNAAYAMLGREGYDAKRAEISIDVEKVAEYIL